MAVNIAALIDRCLVFLFWVNHVPYTLHRIRALVQFDIKFEAWEESKDPGIKHVQRAWGKEEKSNCPEKDQ